MLPSALGFFESFPPIAAAALRLRADMARYRMWGLVEVGDAECTLSPRYEGGTLAKRARMGRIEQIMGN
jgi:hypothetical protein